MNARHSVVGIFFASLCACTSGVDPGDAGAPVAADAAVDVGAMHFADAAVDAVATQTDASCEPPDLLVVLDRSDSMTSLVGSSGTRIDLATQAIEHISAPPTDTTVRFGLEVLPQINGAECSTELVVPIGAGHGVAIANALTSMSPQTDYGTPIGVALQSADAALATIKVDGRAQSIVLVTDGGECCECGTNDGDVAIVQKLESEGVDTFVVGFGGDDDPVLLNDLACAGHTASNFSTSCTCTQAGCAASSSIDATKTQLYFKASDGVALKTALTSITNQTCCNCNVPN